MNRKGIAILVGILSCAVSQAQITLTHNGSTVNINENTATVSDWIVGGVDHVFANSWYFRDGDTVSASLVSTISAPTITLFGSRGAEVVYTDNDLTVSITYWLATSTNGLSSDLAEQVTVDSRSGINLRLFQYNDFDMDGSFGGDTATRLNSSTIEQVDGGASETTGGTPIPDFSEIDLWPSTLTNITGTAGYNLDTAAGSGIGQTVSGDVAFAYQWNESIADGGAFALSTDKVLAVPEPASLIALGFGAIALLRRRKRVAAR